MFHYLMQGIQDGGSVWDRKTGSMSDAQAVGDDDILDEGHDTAHRRFENTLL